VHPVTKGSAQGQKRLMGSLYVWMRYQSKQLGIDSKPFYPHNKPI
jgi:hypothetical protein